MKKDRDYGSVNDHLREITQEGADMLRSDVRALDVVERMVQYMEASGLYIAGKGSGANRAGYVELDASIMDGQTRRGGAVAALRDIVHPISAARRVMDVTPHILIAGTGATHFALKQGLEFVEDPSRYYVTAVGVRPQEQQAPGLSHGTVGAVALDTAGHLAAATSTGGIFGKLEGRVGDTPLIGAGTWADDSVAVSCTGLGEYFILAGGAFDVSARVKYQQVSLQEAADRMIRQVGNLGGNGGLIAVSSKAEVSFAYNGIGMKRARISSTQELEVAIY